MDDEDHFELTHRLSSATHRRKFICLASTLGALLCAAVVVIVALSAVIGIRAASGGENDNDVCLTPSCIDLSTTVRQNLNEEIDPCEDFYNFSCGGWNKRTVPPSTGGTEMALQLIERNEIAMMKVLESGQDDEVQALRKAFHAYQSCMNSTAIGANGTKPLLDTIKMSGGWSLLDGSDSGWHLNGTAFVEEKLLSSPAFFHLSLELDIKNPSRYLMSVVQDGLSLGNLSLYLEPNSTGLATLQGLIFSVLSTLAPSANQTDLQEAAADITDFEIKLAKISEDPVKVHANLFKNYKVRTLRSLSELWPSLDWITFSKRLFNNVSRSINATEPVYVVTPSYFHNLTSLVQNTSNSTLENYAKWQVIRVYLSYISFPEVQEALLTVADQGQRLSGAAVDRYKTCVQFVQSVLPMSMARLYAKHILPSHTKENTSIMIKHIKQAFKERLDENTWLDDTTRDLCKDKVSATEPFISYPNQLFNDTWLNGIYAKYEIFPRDFFGNFQRSTSQQLKYGLKKLHQKVDKATAMWENSATQVNAFYEPRLNSLIIMEAISRPPWFDPRWPDYFKFGALGAVTGHELTHGFDTSGRNFDKDGVYRLWWTNASVMAFEDRAKCFVKQYSEYNLFGHFVDGNASVPDNIADNGGMKVAFRAYKDYVSANPTTASVKKLPALSNYTTDQMYFIAWAQLWCAAYTEEGFTAAANGDHAPSVFRAIGSAVNSPEFADTFKCPKDSKMNPTDKCLLW